ncbi:hypothetical protein TNCV_1855131 [Trichonephila clavipes]|nr:hypothetical protein TNCV_1855131 [Trichonephila clavipes]
MCYCEFPRSCEFPATQLGIGFSLGMVTTRANTTSPLKILRGLVLDITPATFDTKRDPSPPTTGCNSKLKAPISVNPCSSARVEREREMV